MQNITQLYADVNHLLERECLVGLGLHRDIERLALDVAQYQIPVFGIGKVVVEERQTSMPELGKQCDLAVIRIGRVNALAGAELANVDLFDSDKPPTLFRISGQIDDAKASLPDFAHQLVASEEQCSGTGGRDHRGRRGRRGERREGWLRDGQNLQRGKWPVTGKTGCRIKSVRCPAFIAKV